MEDACPKELSKQSEFSPDKVHDKETLVYLLIDPRQIKDGELTSTAFSKKELKQGTLSICRAGYSTAEDAKRNIFEPQFNKNSERKLVGAYKAICLNVRTIYATNRNTQQSAGRAFCVIDDGERNFPAHAVLAYSDITKKDKFWDKNDQTAVRENLIELFQNHSKPLDLEDCFKKE